MLFHPTLYYGYNLLSVLRLKLIHVSKNGLPIAAKSSYVYRECCVDNRNLWHGLQPHLASLCFSICPWSSSYCSFSPRITTWFLLMSVCKTVDDIMSASHYRFIIGFHQLPRNKCHTWIHIHDHSVRFHNNHKGMKIYWNRFVVICCVLVQFDFRFQPCPSELLYFDCGNHKAVPASMEPK